MSGTEAGFIRKLNSRLKGSTVYHCGMNASLVAGIPDRYYEGVKRPLWVEFKHIKKPTHQFDARVKITELQRAWLTRNYENGGEPIVVVGVGMTEGFILDRPEEWNRIWFPDINECRYRYRLMPIDDIANYIARFTCGTR